MNTPHADLSKFSRFGPMPVTSEFLLATPGAGDEADDEDWLEFLSLGARIDSPHAVGVGGWRHAPVLLSY